MTNNSISNTAKENKWEFDAPKFWNLSESTRQNRQSDEWFRPENISAASFPTLKRTKPYAAGVKNAKVPHKATTTTTTTIRHQAQHSQEPSVFDRLSRESTVSFSRKTNQPLTTERNQHPKSRPESSKSKELNTESSKQTVGQRAAILEKTYQTIKPAAVATDEKNRAPAMEKSTTPSTHQQRPPSQSKTLFEEIQISSSNAQVTVVDQEPPTKRKIPLNSSHQSLAAPASTARRSAVALSRKSTAPTLIARRSTVALSRQSIAAASIRKSIPPTETKKQQEKKGQTVVKYFDDLLEGSTAKQEKRLKEQLDIYWSRLIERNKKKHSERQKLVKQIRLPSPVRLSVPSTTVPTSPVTASIILPNRLSFSPRKRTISMVGLQHAAENIKKARNEIEKGKEVTAEYESLTASDRARIMASGISNNAPSQKLNVD